MVLFENNELYNIDIIKNAEIIFYSRNDEDSLLVSINRNLAKINMKFEEGPYKIVTLINQVDGEIYPESQIS